MGSFVDGYCLSCQPVAATATRDLAERVLAVISNLRIDDQFSAHWRNGFGQCKGAVLRELRRIFTESGVEVDTTQKDNPVSQAGALERIFADLNTGDWFSRRCGERPDDLIEYARVDPPSSTTEKAQHIAERFNDSVQVYLTEQERKLLADIITAEFQKD
jgi:hypothetical protein